MRNARNREVQARVEDDELVDAEVPAAVVCAHCGRADCAGCRHEPMRSGVVAVVPWERPGAPALARFWATARAATFDAERFFESLPDGPITPALRFAVASELIAVAAMALAALVPLALIAPAWVKHLWVDETATFARLFAVGVTGVAGLLVAVHAVHGWALDVGARRSGAGGAPGRALRFGLYAAGWDLILGPLGALVVAAKEGWRAALSIPVLGMGLAVRSTHAFLRGCYHLEGASAGPAMRISWVAAGVATAVGAVIVIAAILVAALN